jgi:NitT/TauT family transport system permease protein
VSRPAADRVRLLVRREHPVARVAGLLGIVLLWELAVLGSGLEMLRSGELITHVVTSLERIAIGFALGAVAGIAVGLGVGVFSVLDAVGTPVIAATFPVPKIALLPLLILWLGIGEASKVAVITLGVFFPMAINTYTGVRHADPLLIRAAVSFGAGRWSLIRKVMLPSALPMVFAGLKLGAGTSLLLLVAAEMIAASSGIGFLVLNAQNLMETTKLMVGIVLLSLLGLASHWLLTRLERVAIPWKADA